MAVNKAFIQTHGSPCIVMTFCILLSTCLWVHGAVAVGVDPSLVVVVVGQRPGDEVELAPLQVRQVHHVLVRRLQDLQHRRHLWTWRNQALKYLRIMMYEPHCIPEYDA